MRNLVHVDESKSHPLQSFEWGEFRKKTGIKVIQTDSFQITIHNIPHTPFTIGYFPKGKLPTKEMIEKLIEIGKQNKCIFIQLEPNVEKFTSETYSWTTRRWTPEKFGLRPAAHPLFTKYTFILDLTKSEEELLKNMHPKTRYNVRVAQRRGVIVKEDNSQKAFETYLQLTQETTQRQKFYAHNEQYHRLMWETLRQTQGKHSNNELSAHLLVATYNKKPLTAWILFVFHDTFYYPYGASSNEHREVMASNLMMWEAITFGKRLGLKKFDMWGALSEAPDEKDPWFGFHRFKQGYGPRHVEFIGSYDLVINPVLYEIYKIVDKLRWTLLRFKRN